MEFAKDNPGVYIPPPLFYAGTFLVSLLLQRFLPIDRSFFEDLLTRTSGFVLIVVGLSFNLPALIQFIRTRNTVITIKPAVSLQTSGIFSVSRNPMYLSLLLFYLGIGLLFGNWWTMILFPALVLLITQAVIRKEERYLERAFGDSYREYKKKVRRWI